MLQQNKAPPIVPKPKSKAFAQLNGKGRVQLYALQACTEVTILVYNLYGWTNANTDKAAAKRTGALLQAILDDMAMQPQGPAMIVGDLNGDTHTFPILQQALGNHLLIDVGAQASQWGQQDSDYTCSAPGTNAPTRRDYVFATPEAYGGVSL